VRRFDPSHLRAGSLGWTALGLLLCLLVGDPVAAQSVTLAGRDKDRARLVVDGKPYTVAVGENASGVRFLRWVGEVAEVQAAGRVLSLQSGGAAGQIGAATKSSSAREIVLTAGPGGHFTTLGSINGQSVRFMVDTGATLVSMGRDEAQRLGLDLSNARVGTAQTANGPVPMQVVTLSSVRVGEVEVFNVLASVGPQSMPYLLLGNSFLTRFQMQRHNDEMRLQVR
jgi:aspartyl protease family protein